MAANGFLEQKPTSPTGFGLVLLLHGAAIAGVLMIKNQTWTTTEDRLKVVQIEREPIPEPPPPEPRPAPEPMSEPVRRVPVDAPDRQVPLPVPGPGREVTQGPVEYAEVIGTAATGGGATVTPVPTETETRPIVPPAPPVRTVAEFDSRFTRELQPPYPAAEQRLEREGSVRVQVSIGANGRVLAVQRVSATSDAFWRVTERQALTRWRFRPATVDGRPVESSKTLTVHFRLDQ